MSDSVDYDLHQEIALRGIGFCEVLRGEVFVDGHKFGEKSKFEIHSPTVHHAVTLNPVQMGTKLKFSELRAPLLPHQLNSYPTMDWTTGSDKIILPGLFLCNIESGFIPPENYSQVIAHINDHSRLCIIGGKGSGKSTTNRIILNHLLNFHEKVYWIDLDPGQPEFTPPGWLSLNEVYGARIGPSFAHLKSSKYTQLNSSFLGSLSPGSCPKRYLSCVQYLSNKLSKLLSNRNKFPVIINAMGWLRELGLKLLIDSIRILNVNIIYYLKTETSNDLPDGMSLIHITQQKGFETRQTASGQSGHKLFTGNSVSKSAVSRQKVAVKSRQWHPRDMRDIANMIYFGSYLTAKAPFRIKLGEIVFNFVEETVVPDHIFQVVNNVIVSLSSIPNLPEKNRSGIRMLTKNSRNIRRTGIAADDYSNVSSISFGWIRHIDPENQFIYVHTPMTIETLNSANINCLSIGSLPLPDALMTNNNENGVYCESREQKSFGGNRYKNVAIKRKHINKID